MRACYFYDSTLFYNFTTWFYSLTLTRMIRDYDLWNTPTPPLSCGKPFFSHLLQPSADFLCSQFECNYSEICVLFYWLPGGRAGTVFPDFSALWSQGKSPSPSGAFFWDLHCMIGLKLQRSFVPHHNIGSPRNQNTQMSCSSRALQPLLHLPLPVCGEAALLFSLRVCSDVHPVGFFYFFFAAL